MVMTIECDVKPIDVMQMTLAEDPKMEDYTVTIDGKVCPPGIRDIVIAGLAARAGITGMTFGQVLNEYLSRKGV